MRASKMVLGGLMVMMLGLVGCGGDGEDEALGASKKNADLIVNDKDPFYEPEKNLEIALNREVTFNVFNDGEKVHNITIPGFEIDMDVAPNQSIDIKLPAVSAAPRDGFYLFYCKFHQSEGEAGRINISK